MDAHELPSGELLVELVDAMNRGLQATILGDEPDIVAVRFRETDLGRAQEDHALAARSDDARRRAQPWLEAVALDLIAVFGSEDRERPDGLVAEEDWAKGDPGRLAGELGHDLCRADPVVVETSLLDGVTGEAAEVQARLPADCGVQCRHPRGDAQEEACRLVGDDDLAACVQDGMRLPGPRPCFRECRDQFGGAVAGALTQDRVRAGYCLRKPARGLGWKVGMPGRDVEDRNCIASHGVPNGYAGTDPLVKARAPVLGPADQHGSGASSAVPIPFVPVAHSDQHDHGAMLLSRARPSVSLSPWTVRIRPAASATVTTPPTPSTSLAIDAAAPPSWANTISCSRVSSVEGRSCADATGALFRPGSTWYCSRQRYQDVATSGRTPRTRSSPARNRSRAAVTAWYRSASPIRWRFAGW